MTAVLTISGQSLVLPHVACIGVIETMGIRFGWQVKFGISVATFSFVTAVEAAQERERLIGALSDYWSARLTTPSQS